jgi:hypothetical protein
MSLQLSNYTVEHMPAHLKPTPELSKSVQGALEVEVVVPKLIVSGNSIVVQTLVPNSQSMEPWNALLLGLMVHNGRREQLGIIIGRIVVRRIHELREKNMEILLSDIGKCNGHRNVPHKRMDKHLVCSTPAAPNLSCLGRLYQREIPLKLTEAAGVPAEVGDASEKLAEDGDASRTRW